ncbi:MAG TPA: hypothetical protein VLA19_15090 [Herpetosiphonaceae bacterium]|nr:hypothetical protein [Herpetosiphonaceae bacterium]
MSRTPCQLSSGQPCGRKCDICGAKVYAYHVAGPFVPPDYVGLDNPVKRWAFVCERGHVLADVAAEPEQLSLELV